VVLLKDETAAGSTYKLAGVTEVFRDEKDGRVRKVSVAYKNVTEQVFRVSTRPIHNIVLVVPAEDADLPPLLALLWPAGPSVAPPAPAGPSVVPPAPCWPSCLWPCQPLLALLWFCRPLLSLLWPCRPLLALLWPCLPMLVLLWPCRPLLALL
jgi:hypothetical protein